MSVLIDVDSLAIKKEFFSILKFNKLSTLYQPIISLRDASILGFEALTRGPSDSLLYSPLKLFEYAEKYDKLWDLEYLCRKTIITNSKKLDDKYKLFLNVSPDIINDSRFIKGFTKKYLIENETSPEKIVFEITENTAIDNMSEFKNTIENYRVQNYEIAIDDAGAGYSGLNLISDINPNYIKLDMQLIRDIDKDFIKQSLIKSMVEYATLTNTDLIAEGIETRNELDKLIELGINYGQGFYIQKPLSSILELRNSLVEEIKDANRKNNHLSEKKISNLRVSNITSNEKTLNSNISISQVFEILKKDKYLDGLCVTDEEKVLGVVTRNDFFKKLSGQFGYNLFSKKPITSLMDKTYLEVDSFENIDIVAKKALSRPPNKVYDFIVVTEKGKYSGIITVKDLLEKTIEIEINNAKHINPLSNLPGNVLIEKNIEIAIKSNLDKIILYLDIDNFKAYNDVYGFENGDRFIKELSKILKNNTPEEEFLGHIGGDDFLAIIDEDESISYCEKIIEEFDNSIDKFYNPSDYQKGYIETKNRSGIKEIFPLLSISIVGLYSSDYKNIEDFSKDISKLKKDCKQISGSNYIIE
ncbi:MAG: GGDEF domain-containing protein [Eubacteriales bacterium]